MSYKNDVAIVRPRKSFKFDSQTHRGILQSKNFKPAGKTIKFTLIKTTPVKKVDLV